MPQEIRSAPVTFASSGIVLKSTPDELPITAYKALINAYTDQENSLSVRSGFTRLNDGLPSAPHSAYYLRDVFGMSYRYAIADRKLYITDLYPYPGSFVEVTGGGNLSAAADPRAIFATYTLIGSLNWPYIFMADGTAFLKHPGGTTEPARRVGIPAPAVAATVTLEGNTGEIVEACEDSGDWTASGVTLSTVNPGQTGNALGLTLAAPGVGGAFKALATVMELGQNDLSDVIEIWVRFPTDADAKACTQIVLAFGLSESQGDTTFATRFEKAITPSQFEAATQVDRSEEYIDSVPTAADEFVYRRTVMDQESDQPLQDRERAEQIQTGVPIELRPGSGVWNRVRIRKDEFNRVGASAVTAPELGWDTIAAVRIDVKGAACEVDVDEIVAYSTGKLFGTDIQWCYTYYNSLTDTESEPSPAIDVPYPGANYDQYRLVFPTCPSTTPPAADPDYIRIYRMGGTLTEYGRVDQVAYAEGSTVEYVDNIPDAEISEGLDTNNQLPPDGFIGVELHDNKLWGWGASSDAPNVVRHSRKNHVESWPTENKVYVGTGSERVLRCMEYGNELFVWTLTRVYRMVGNEARGYEAVATEVSQGIKGPHGIMRGLKGLFQHSYDGIYEFPAGRKISEPINHVFFRKMVNEIPPLAADTEAYVAMGFWDSKLYFSYRSDNGPGTCNDRMLIWDTIYERWHFYLYGAQSLFTEPENNILVGCNLVQWDSIVNGVAANFTYSGAWPMQLESGVVDVCEDATRGIFWAVDTKEYDLGLPDQEKRFVDFVVDADTQGLAIWLEAAFDSTEDPSPYEIIGQFASGGRSQIILPAPDPDGDSRCATRIGIRMIGKTDPLAVTPTKIYKIIHRFMVEPPRHRTFVTEWSDYGDPAPKFFRELWIVLDTFGKPLDRIEVQVDGALGQTIQALTESSGKKSFYYGLPPDLRGTLARLKIIPQSGNEVKMYDHMLRFMVEPPVLSTLQTPYSDEGWPYFKLWKEVVLDIDTAGEAIPFDFWLDGKIVDTWEFTTDYRAEMTHSVPKDTFGKLGRVTVNQDYLDECCLPNGFRFYGIRYVIDKEPADVTLADSYVQTLNWDRQKILRRLWMDMKNPDADVTLEVYIDEVYRLTKTISRSTLTSGHKKRRIDLKDGLKGNSARFIFSCPFAFQLYWQTSEIEMKNVNTEDGYARIRLVPPQTF